MMKGTRAVRKMLTILLLLMMMPCAARAETERAYDWTLIPGYATLNEAQRALFGAAYAAALRGETQVPVLEDVSYDDAVAAMNLLLDECPELCALDSRYQISYARNHPETVSGVTLVYARPLDTQTVLLDTAETMAAQAEGSAWERELTLHDMLCSAAVYDLDTSNQATAYGALVDGRAGCGGYARALTLLCRLAGIPCQTVSGTTRVDGGEERHAWCVLYIGGAFTQTDPTWNDQDAAGLITHWYFNLTDAQMAADHFPDADTLALPCTDASLSWHARNGLVVPAEEDEAQRIIDGALYALVTRGETVNLRFEDGYAYANFVARTQEYVAAYNRTHPQARYEGAYRLMHSDEQRCCVLLGANRAP